MKRYGVFFVFLMGYIFSSLSALSGSRVWTDRLGNRIEAEFVCINAGKVVLNGIDGKTYKPKYDSLSEEDQKYLQSQIPPKIEVDFSKTQDRRSNCCWMSMRGKVKFKESSKIPYTGKLRVIFYMFGENDYLHEYVVLDRVESDLNFNNSDSCQIRGNFFRMEDIPSGNYGVEYKGFFVLVLDDKNQIIALKSNRKQFIHQMDDFLKLRVGEHFARDMESRSQSRFFSDGYCWHPYCCHYHYSEYWGCN